MKKCVSPKAMKSHVKKDMKEVKSLVKDDKKLLAKMPKKKK
jgi:hypothetical protein